MLIKAACQRKTNIIYIICDFSHVYASVQIYDNQRFIGCSNFRYPRIFFMWLFLSRKSLWCKQLRSWRTQTPDLEFTQNTQKNTQLLELHLKFISFRWGMCPHSSDDHILDDNLAQILLPAGTSYPDILIYVLDAFLQIWQQTTASNKKTYVI